MTQNNLLTDTNTFEINAAGSEEAKHRELLNRPDVYARVMEMAAGIDKVMGQTAKVLESTRIGAKLKDKKSNTIFVYEAFMQPFKPDMLTQLVLDTAKMPWTKYMQSAFMCISEHVMSPDGKTLMTRKTMLSARDFVKMIAIGRWEVLDYGPQQGSDENVWGGDWRDYLKAD